MSFEITTAFVIQYKDAVAHLLQQKGSKLRQAVMEDSYVGKSGMVVNQIGKVTAQRITDRHGDTPLISTPHDSRWVYPKDYDWADLIDNVDKLRTIVDFTSPYAMNGAYAIGRAIDDEIIRAFDETSNTGEDGDSTTSYDTNMTVDNSSDMSVTNLIEAKKNLLAKEVDIDTDRLWVAMGAEQVDALMAITQATSLDYNTRPVLVDGRITSFMGFNFIDHQGLDLSGSDRNCPYWAQSGMHLGMWGDLNVRISERDDKRYSTQVYVSATFGATRLEEGKVGLIVCAE
jgi:hypothetical protein